jgi:hypothetical protein
MGDENERSVASTGSHPVSGGPITLRLSNKQQEMLSRLSGRQSGTLVPLDLPQPTLTDEERHAIAVVRNCAMTRAERFLTQSDAEREATLVLWRLRERLG